MSRAYEVWIEGFAATGESRPARCLGVFEGEDFEDACRTMASRERWGADYDMEKNTYWGCRLYDNEADARESFG